jgi:hypothetical protein
MSCEKWLCAREAPVCHHFFGVLLFDPVDKQERIPVGKERLDVGHGGRLPLSPTN